MTYHLFHKRTSSSSLQPLAVIKAILIGLLCKHGDATSIKMDFLPFGDVRTDPIINPDCLSDHVHTFYGANKMRPETTYQDLRGADGNSGNVLENKSLYWHPTVYRVDEDGIYQKAEIYFASAYYIWTTGEATSFPDGFKMVAGFQGIKEARAVFECVGCGSDEEFGCERDSFPVEECDELEVSMAFPSCWDGVNIDSNDHMSHVSYDIEGGRFDGECPATHPVKLPEIQLFFRILPYPGGTHVFADGTSYYHADYFSGWDSNELQYVLDNCENYSDAASPDAWCENFLTFRDAPKSFGDDENIVQKLENLQPDVFDISTITDEVIDNTEQLPRTACTGTLKPVEGPTAPTPTAPTPTAPTPTAPTPTEPPVPTSTAPTELPVPTSTAPIPTPTAPTPTGTPGCSDSPLRFRTKSFAGKVVWRGCDWVGNKPYRCNLNNDELSAHCPVTCGACDDYTCTDSLTRFKLVKDGKRIARDCEWVDFKQTRIRCGYEGVSDTCSGICDESCNEAADVKKNIFE